MNYSGVSYNQQTAYLDAIYAALEKGMAAKEVVCSITTGFRAIPSMRTAAGLNPYHASVADIGYGFDAVQGTINRIRNGESITLVKELLVFDLDTLRISVKQLSPNFELAAKKASPDIYHLVEQSRYLNHQIAQSINEAIKLGRALFGTEWDSIRSRIENIQAIPRL
ncbi:hypothetical protein ACFFF5_20500 [Lederbergia wuyishanensis]|uniref:Uncharacterized protein n=1 Tax=Lederbergia wuyishanensis TaxID=1347903 RepID=A0ABU0D8L7_9BACI|nr:hypothetical protein [Lederbergia wuyishanensis]MCJ8007655.1 hypothetical protein [Lederbergia wuyishanensis]MDQ0344761.1 hypothetical protein [Lederbergia wuyishanensis]